MRAANALYLIGLTIVVPGCALVATPNSSEYQQGFQAGYAACEHDLRIQPRRELGPSTSGLKISNPPWLAPPLVDEPAKARILGVREPVVVEPAIAIINTVPVQHESVVIINGAPTERARILGVTTSLESPVRAKINAVRPAPLTPDP